MSEPVHIVTLRVPLELGHKAKVQAEQLSLSLSKFILFALANEVQAREDLPDQAVPTIHSGKATG